MIQVLGSLIIGLFSSHAQLAANSSLLQDYVAQPMINEIVAFEPIEGHKINLKSKNSCGSGRMIEATEKKVECQMTMTGASNLELYVCDKKNTYCKREQAAVTTGNPSGLTGWLSYYWNRVVKSQSWKAPYRTEVSHNNVARGFMHNDLKGAIQKAKAENKKLMVYFTQIYCPPCRMMKETSLASDAFQEIAKDFVKVQIDTDIDVSPELIKPLKHKYTPTMMLFNSDFKEMDRHVGIMSPKNFQTWFKKLETLNWPVASEVAKKENLTETEKEYLSQWHFSRFEDEEMLSYGKDSKSTWGQLIQLKAAADKVKGLKKIRFKSLACRSKEEKAVFYTIEELFESAVEKKDAKLFNRAVAFMEELEKVASLNEGDDELACAYGMHNIYIYLRYYSKKMEKTERLSEINRKIIANLDTYPKLPGVKKTTQIEVEKSRSSNDETKKKSLYAQMREDNKKDYTYDYWEASDALRAKKYDLALEKINKSLSIAKDRSWQKAFSLKVSILKEMKKKEEALGLIKQTLDGLQLPYSEYPKVHVFVQQLREKQRDLEKI